MNSNQFDPDDGWSVYKRLLGFVKPYWSTFIVAIIGMATAAATEVGFSALMKPMLDGTFVQRDPFWVNVIPIAIVAIFLLRGLGGYLVSYCMARVARYVIKDIRSVLFDRVLSMPTRFYDKNNSSKIISKLIYDVESLAGAVSKAVTVVIQDSLTLVGLLAWMAYLNWQLTLLFLIMGPLMAGLFFFINKRLRKVTRRLQNTIGDVTHVAQETIQAQKMVKIFNAQQFEQKRFEKNNENNRLQNMKLVITSAASAPLVQLMAAVLLAAIIYLSTRPEMQSVITVGTFMSFITAMLLLFPPINRLTTINVVIQRGIAAGQSLFSFIDEERERDTGTIPLKQCRGEVRFEQVSFAYDSAKGRVLESINLQVQAGQSIAFVGKSGSGKSTLVSLLPRFYDVSEGRIVIDGVDVRDVPLADLRQHFALVSQDVRLFNDTIAHNIAYGALEDATEDKIREAARMAHALEFIEKLPQGFDTEVGEQGALLSGGQRQRLAIARAILKNAPILILDEATSALDSESERHIQEALDELMKNRTTFVIAHRLSTIEKADLIIVMQDGRVVETGSHSSLMEHDGVYAGLRKIQQGDVLSG